MPLLDLDVRQIERVITNLVDNAVKYTEPGGTVRVTVTRLDDYAVITVHDNGSGIRREDLPKLFDKFQRQTGSTRTEGTGLGLFIVRAIVEAHRGTVDVSSTLGEGTTVTVRLPGLGPSSEGGTVRKAVPKEGTVAAGLAARTSALISGKSGAHPQQPAYP
ncbi:MAG: sensor histidine kinase [Candidatus Binatia bacterium]